MNPARGGVGEEGKRIRQYPGCEPETKKEGKKKRRSQVWEKEGYYTPNTTVVENANLPGGVILSFGEEKHPKKDSFNTGGNNIQARSLEKKTACKPNLGSGRGARRTLEAGYLRNPIGPP